MDEVNHDVKALLDVYRDGGYKIIIFTGRDGAAKEHTEKWLDNHLIKYDHFDIRPTGDMRKDYIVKKEMFDKIKDEYAITGVFDDRDQVVRLWRGMGIRCYQVDYGNF